MIRVSRPGVIVIGEMLVSGWWLEGDDEWLEGSFNDPRTQAGKILIAAAFIHLAGFAGFELVDGQARPECFEVARYALDAVAKARSRPVPAQLTSRQRLRAWLIRRLGGTP